MDKLGKPVTFNPLYIPEHTNCQNLPDELKEKIKELYKHDSRLVSLYNNFISPKGENKIKELIDFNLLLDGYRGTDFFKTFPQYRDYKHLSLAPTTLHKRVVHKNFL